MSRYFLRTDKENTTIKRKETIIKVFEGSLSSKKLYVFNIMVDLRPFQINKDYLYKIDNTEEAIKEALMYEEIYTEISAEQVYDILNNVVKEMIF